MEIIRYKLKDCESTKGINQMVINGFKVYKGKFINFKNPVEQIEKLIQLVEKVVTTDEAIQKEMTEENLKKLEKEKVENFFKETVSELKGGKKEEITPKPVKKTVDDYWKMTKKQIIDEIVGIDPKLYNDKAFYGMKKEMLIQTIVNLNKLELTKE